MVNKESVKKLAVVVATIIGMVLFFGSVFLRCDELDRKYNTKIERCKCTAGTHETEELTPMSVPHYRCRELSE